MKKILLVALGLSTIFTSCKNVLDIEDLQSLDEEKVWKDPNLVNAYMANRHSLFGNWSAGADVYSQPVVGVPFQLNTISPTAGGFKTWDYTNIRESHTARQKVEESTRLSQDVKNSTLGEAYSLRAF